MSRKENDKLIFATPRGDGVLKTGEMTSGMPNPADNTVVPLALPIEKVQDSSTTLPSRQV
ncbi:MAG TPA: hypothetical protein VEM14_03305 [Gemmatimonadaceae bacterium]|nr:hypothetical protein [Gemmatimonadaceae bacterium]